MCSMIACRGVLLSCCCVAVPIAKFIPLLSQTFVEVMVRVASGVGGTTAIVGTKLVSQIEAAAVANVGVGNGAVGVGFVPNCLAAKPANRKDDTSSSAPTCGS